LSASLILIVLAGAGIFYLAYGSLSETATKTGISAASARESEDTLQKLQLLQTKLEAEQEVIAMTSRVTANSQNYAYQDLLVRDLTVYAERAQLTIKNISFADQAATPAPTEGTPNASSAVGLKKATVDITLETPVNYESLLNFLHYIEQNLTKLKISKVGLAKGEAGSVTIDVLNLEVYLQ
jgi:hypothetical protein